MNKKTWNAQLTSWEFMDMESMITISKITDDCLDAYTVASFRVSAMVAFLPSHFLE